jgi:D-alanine-D-alanine ligase
VAITKTGFDVERVTRTPGQQKLAITVLSGGPSGEREVSLQSGQCVAAALESLGHKVYLEDISPENVGALARAVDCVFVALHGRFGEDGQVQEILERRGLAYCGSGPAACALAMDKAAAKERFKALNIPTPRFSVAASANVREAIAAWSLPVVVKPVKEGSSLHCHIVRDHSQLRLAVEQVVSNYGSAMIEEYIPGREITIGILGDRVLPPIEIRTKREFYDYKAKYVDEDTQYLFDVNLPKTLLEHMGRMSLEAHRGLGCRDFSRLDWRVDDSLGKAYLLEANVIPGMTSHSLLPKAATQAGINFPQACQMIVEFAVKRRFGK